MANSTFIYVTYIRTTQKKLWEALTSSKIIQQYWFGLRIESDWCTGSSWEFFSGDELMDSGKILESIPRKRLVRSWLCQWRADLRKEGISHCTYDIVQVGKSVKLTVTHTMRRNNSKFIKAVSEGWPMCISNLKSLLETKKIALSEHPGHENSM